MRIALLTNNVFPPREGIARHVLETALRLRARGHAPMILARGDGTAWRQGEIQGIPLRHYPYLPVRPFHHTLSGIMLQRWLDDGAEGAELLHVHLPLLPPLTADLPVVVTVHSPLLADTGAIAEPGLKSAAIRLNARLVSRRFEQRWLDRADAILAVSAGVRNELTRHYRLHGRPIAIVGNGVDVAFFGALPRAPEPVVLYVGRLGYRKGLFRLLDAFARVETSLAERLVLVGEGPLARDLMARAAALGIARRVTFAGFGDRETVRSWLARAACFVNPADYESGPLTLLEAMAAGTPVVTTRTGLVAELGAEPPLLVAEASESGLRAGLRATLAEPVAAAARALAAKRLVHERFTWERVVDRLEQAYRAPEALAA